MSRFPVGSYGHRRLEFFPAPRKAPLRAFAALVFPFTPEGVVVCDILGRGWCIPSGSVEPGESSADAARREAREEGGLELGRLHYIGCYRITEGGEVKWADCFAARVERLSEITMPEESAGRRVVSLGELPAVYHQWDDLMERVFAHARDVLARAGIGESSDSGGWHLGR